MAALHPMRKIDGHRKLQGAILSFSTVYNDITVPAQGWHYTPSAFVVSDKDVSASTSCAQFW